MSAYDVGNIDLTEPLVSFFEFIFIKARFIVLPELM